MKKIVFQFQCVTWKLEKALANLPYDHFEISEEVQEQVGSKCFFFHSKINPRLFCVRPSYVFFPWLSGWIGEISVEKSY